MEAAKFRTSPSGSLARTPDGAPAFVPHPLPPPLELGAHVAAIAEASRALGELSGVGQALENPMLVVAPFQRREAVASSRIEGTVASLSDVFSIEAGGAPHRRPGDTVEVRNYVAALDHAVARLRTLPLSLRLVREIHAVLFAEIATPGGGAYPAGEFRRVQNWIGGSTPAAARYVPPPADKLSGCLDAFERYVHARLRLPALVDAALIHYQFEAIHPFPDGNGRVGRILIPLYLMHRDVLSAPLLYLSPYFERHRKAYYERLLAVSRNGEWAGWIDFFLRGVIEQSADTIRRIGALAKLRKQHLAHVMEARGSASLLRLIELLFVSPYVSMPLVRDRFSITHRAAQQQIDRLVALSILAPVRGESRPRLYVARAILQVLQDPSD